MIKSVLDSVFKPLEIAVVHIKGHQKLTTLEGKGNQIADQAAKEAVSDRSKPIRVLKLRDISNNKGRKVEQVFSEKELKAIEELEMHQRERREWVTKDGRKFLSKALA